MIVYVETNFLLELAFLQEEHESCEEVLRLAESRKIKLVVPAFSITEARSGLRGKAKQRLSFDERLRRELRELSRSNPYKEIHNQTQSLTKALVESSQREQSELDSITSRILQAGEIAPLLNSTVRAAVQNESELGFEQPSEIREHFHVISRTRCIATLLALIAR